MKDELTFTASNMISLETQINSELKSILKSRAQSLTS